MGHPTQSEERLEEVSAELSLKEEKDRNQEQRERKGMGVGRQHEKGSKERHTRSETGTTLQGGWK